MLSFDDVRKLKKKMNEMQRFYLPPKYTCSGKQDFWYRSSLSTNSFERFDLTRKSINLRILTGLCRY